MHKLDLFHRKAYELVPFETIKNFKGLDLYPVAHYYNDVSLFEEFFSLVIAENTVALDIGCNIGLHTDLMLRIGAERVFAFEASKTNIEYLNEKYQSETKVEILPIAISNKTCEITFYDSDKENGITSLAKTKDIVNSKTIIERKVKCFRLDDLPTIDSLKNISCIKLDIEGADLLALDGGRNVIDKNRPYIILEFAHSMFDYEYHGSKITKETALALFAELGYVPYNIYGICMLNPSVFAASALVDTFDMILVPEECHENWSKYLCPQYQYKIYDKLFERIENHDIFPGYQTMVSMPRRIYDFVNASSADQSQKYLQKLQKNLWAILGSIDEIEHPSLRTEGRSKTEIEKMDSDLKVRGKLLLKLIYLDLLDAAYELAIKRMTDKDDIAKYSKLVEKRLTEKI